MAEVLNYGRKCGSRSLFTERSSLKGDRRVRPQVEGSGDPAIENCLMVGESIGRCESRELRIKVSNRGQRMALYMLKLALRIGIEKMSASNIVMRVLVEKRAGLIPEFTLLSSFV